MKRTLLIDSDVFLYAAASATETEVQWDDDLWTVHGYLNEAIGQFDSKIAGIKEEIAGDRIVMAMTASNNFRAKVLPTYKGNRKDKRKPVTFKALRKYAMETYISVEMPTLEADDVLGIMSTSEGDSVIVTIDKDLDTIPGLHFNTLHPERGVYMVTPAMADAFFLKQALMGDTTDGYGGCPGIGPKTADKILAPYITDTEVDITGAWGAITAAYIKAGLSETVALQMARCARILRSSDYDQQQEKVILWTPPKA